MKILFIIALLQTILYTNVKAQKYSGLEETSGLSFKLFHSNGMEARANAIGPRVEKAKAYYEKILSFKPSFTLLILTENDWSKFTSFPVYGMPHYANDSVLVVAATDNALWQSFLPPLESLPTDLREKIKTVYAKGSGVSMEAFFDLLALHELGHAFHMQAKINMQRKWMGELFVNILLHTYIAENEPSSLPALELFPQMVIGNGSKDYKYTRLNDIEELYAEIGQYHPKNYGWYQCRWHAAAGKIYQVDGSETGGKIWNAFSKIQPKMSDAALLSLLEKAGAGSVATMMRTWDSETK